MCRNGKYEMGGECDCKNGEISDDGKRICVDKNWEECVDENIGTVVGEWGGVFNDNVAIWSKCNAGYNDQIKGNGKLYCLEGKWLECKQDDQWGDGIDNKVCAYNDNKELQWVECNEANNKQFQYSLLCMDGKWHSCGSATFCKRVTKGYLLYYCVENKWNTQHCTNSGCGGC